MNVSFVEHLVCYHCGTNCPDEPQENLRIHIDEKNFCCQGCKTVYQILAENNLCNYYTFESKPGITPQQTKFEFLDNPEIVTQLVDFKNDIFQRITFFVPSIHCSSCLYLLENLYKIHPAIKNSRVDFLKKQVSIDYFPQKTIEKSTEIESNIEHSPTISLRQVAELLTSLGYEPLISLKDVVQENQPNSSRKLLTKIGVAGFCTGNIMLFSFPEYLGLQDSTYKHLFGLLNFILAIPVVFYSGSGYFDSVYRSLRKGHINIDFPILLGILMAFFRGIYEVFVLHGAGYFDSLTGLVFFLLIGKWFQQKTYDFLSFERDYMSYFPLAVTRLNRGKEEAIPVAELKKGDKILIRNCELIPADGMIYKGAAQIDYSFVTGESLPEKKKLGDLLYAGGKQLGESIEMEVLKEVSQSYITQLWNNDVFKKNHQSNIKTFADNVGKYFTITVLSLATFVAIYWANAHDFNRAMNAFTTILIIACPCALALSYPFALGNGLRMLGKQHFYLKNAEVIERLSKCNTLVFDKTGTLTNSTENIIKFKGKRDLLLCEQVAIKSLVRNSTHPISQKIQEFYMPIRTVEVEQYAETIGLGLSGKVNGHSLKIGSAAFLGEVNSFSPESISGGVAHLSIDNEYLGYYEIQNSYRENIGNMIQKLHKSYEMYVISGDTEAEKGNLIQLFKSADNLYFKFKPQDKLDFIKKLQAEGKIVAMIGDGLNDAGALKQADVGIAITENTMQFSPASDGILQANYLQKLPQFLSYAKFSLHLIQFSFVVSLLYNIFGLSYAITGNLSPIIAAILMPISSASMLLIASLGMILRGKKL